MGNKFKEIHELLEKREDIKKKLQKLEDMKSQTKPHIYEKVKNDYESKLNDIVSSLNGHVDSLEKAVKDLDPQLQELIKKENVIDDAIEELNVRYQLEEFSPDEYNTKKSEYEKQLSSIREKRNIIEKEIEEINSLLISIKGEGVESSSASFEDTTGIMEESVIEEAESIEDIENIDTSDNLDQSFNDLVEETQAQDDNDILSSDKILEEIESSDVQPDSELVGNEDLLGDLESELSGEAISEEGFDSIENLDSLDNLDDLGDLDNMENLEDIGNLENIDTDIEESLDSLVEDISGDLGLEDIGEDIPPDTDIIHEEDLKLDGDTEVEGIKCPKCGFVNKPDAWFCEKCGADLQ